MKSNSKPAHPSFHHAKDKTKDLPTKCKNTQTQQHTYTNNSNIGNKIDTTTYKYHNKHREPSTPEKHPLKKHVNLFNDRKSENVHGNPTAGVAGFPPEIIREQLPMLRQH